MSYFRPHSSEGIEFMLMLRRGIDAYARGEHKPHYPVPAIIYDTILDRYFVMIWDGNECVLDFYNDDYVI